MHHLHGAIHRRARKGGLRQQVGHPVVDASPDDQGTTDHDPLHAGVRQHFLGEGPIRVHRRGENDSPGSGLGHRIEDGARTPNVPCVPREVPCAVRDDVRSRDSLPDGDCVQDVSGDEVRSAGPAIGPVPGDPDNVVALAEQSGHEPAADNSAGSDDRNSHR